MIRHGEPPYLECSSRGDQRFSALYARLVSRDFCSIEELYQSAKQFDHSVSGVDATGHMSNWRDAKGKRAINQAQLEAVYFDLWRCYLLENPDLVAVLIQASGLSDRFGQVGHVCQATALWQLREDYRTTPTQHV